MKNLTKDLTDDFIDQDSDDHDHQDESNLKFLCPSCGTISRDDVLFLCNTCKQEELIYREGVYMCPSCLLPGDNFECILCGSTKVVMKGKKSLTKA